jgi:hypothetical protein
MKLNELRSIIREVIVEEIANESYNKKKLAINEIKRIIAENEIEEEEIEEIFGLGKKKPATDEELDAYLSRNSKLKAYVAKMDPEKAKKWREFVKVNKADRIKDDEAILNIYWDEKENNWKQGSGPSTGGGFNK